MRPAAGGGGPDTAHRTPAPPTPCVVFRILGFVIVGKATRGEARQGGGKEEEAVIADGVCHPP